MKAICTGPPFGGANTCTAWCTKSRREKNRCWTATRSSTVIPALSLRSLIVGVLWLSAYQVDEVLRSVVGQRLDGRECDRSRAEVEEVGQAVGTELLRAARRAALVVVLRPVVVEEPGGSGLADPSLRQAHNVFGEIQNAAEVVPVGRLVVQANLGVVLSVGGRCAMARNIARRRVG